MRRDVIAVRVRDERERLGVPRVEPDLFVRQINAALISDFNHSENLRGSATFDIFALLPFH
jgi:hypothetical protein